jgi:hypothetical protein
LNATIITNKLRRMDTATMYNISKVSSGGFPDPGVRVGEGGFLIARSTARRTRFYIPLRHHELVVTATISTI